MIASVGILVSFYSCSKEDTKVGDDTVSGTVNLKFENFVGNELLSLSSSDNHYVNTNGDSFSVNMYKYYISNIRFVKADASEYHDESNCFLIDAAEPVSLNRFISKVPAGTYTAVKLLLGIDSTRNVSGAQSGDLDPMYGMFWAWSTGYIMAKVEGRFTNDQGVNTPMSFHLGGFSGKYSVLKEVTIPLPQDLKIADQTTSTITFKSDVLKWFEAPILISFNNLSNVGAAGEDAANIANNYKNAFSITAVQN